MSLYNKVRKKKTLGSTNSQEPVFLTLMIDLDQRVLEYIENLKSIVLLVVEQYTYQKVSLITYTIEKLGNYYIITYRPRYLGDIIYSDTNTVFNLRSKFKLNHYYGYKYITDNPLLYHAVNIYNKEISLLKLSWLKVHNNVVFIKSGIGLDDLDLELKGLTTKLSLDGYFVANSDSLRRSKSLDPIHAAGYLEIATLFDDKIISYCNPCIISSKRKFGILTNKLWYERAIKSIILGLIPQYTMVVPNYPLLKYKEIYRKMYSRYPFLSKYESLIKIESLIRIGDTRVVSFNFGSAKQVKEYYQILINDELDLSDSLPLIITGKFWNNKHKKTLRNTEFALVIKNSELPKIPVYNNFLNTAQSLKVDYAKIIPYTGIITDLDELNAQWKLGNIMSDWGKNLYLSTGLISRFSLATSID